MGWVNGLSRVNPLPQYGATCKVGAILWKRVYPRRGRSCQYTILVYP
jgi:hypothetical protein